MSIQPSLSKSRKAQPAPTVSGRYISAEIPAVWDQRIPLDEGGTSANSAGIALCALGTSGDDAIAWEATGPRIAEPSPARNDRRENGGLRPICHRAFTSEFFLESALQTDRERQKQEDGSWMNGVTFGSIRWFV